MKKTKTHGYGSNSVQNLVQMRKHGPLIPNGQANMHSTKGEISLQFFRKFFLTLFTLTTILLFWSKTLQVIGTPLVYPLM